MFASFFISNFVALMTLTPNFGKVEITNRL